MLKSAREHWQSLSRQSKVIWGLAIFFCLLHLLGIAGYILADSTYQPDEIREWSDTVAYLDAAQNLSQRQDLYELEAWEDTMTYYYHPAFALGVSVIDGLPFRLLSFLWMLSQVAAYLGAIYVWYQILTLLNLPTMQATYKKWLPLTIVFTEWFVNLAYGNITSTLMLLSGLMVWAFLKDRPQWASLAALPIALVKPQWLFAFLLPIVFRKWRFLAISFGGLLVLYVVVNGVYLLAVGGDYGRGTLEDYGSFVSRGGEDFPWETDTGSFEQMNHSWEQIFLSYFGEQDWTLLATRAAQLVLLAILAGVVLFSWNQNVTIIQHPQMILWLTGLAYLASMSLLPQLWEIMGSIVFFLFIRSVADPLIRRVSLLYLFYALYELVFAVGYGSGIDALVLPQSIPLTMVTLLLIYAILMILAYRTIRWGTVPTVESGSQSTPQPQPSVAV